MTIDPSQCASHKRQQADSLPYESSVILPPSSKTLTESPRKIVLLLPLLWIPTWYPQLFVVGSGFRLHSDELEPTVYTELHPQGHSFKTDYDKYMYPPNYDMVPHWTNCQEWQVPSWRPRPYQSTPGFPYQPPPRAMTSVSYQGRNVFTDLYLDNWLLKAAMEDELKGVTQFTCSPFQRLGLLIYKKKSC